MKKFYIILIALFLVSGVMAQSAQPCSTCLPEGITFNMQEQIDSFQVNYPECSEVEGYVRISGGDITNLNGLIVLTSIGDYLVVWDNISLTSLMGLDNLTSLGGDLWIYENNDLTSLTGLEGLTSIGGFISIYNNAQTSLTGLDNLTYIGSDLYIGYNGLLTSLTGLDNLTSIGGNLYIGYNGLLTSLTGLDNLTSIGGDLTIWDNAALTSLMGLDNVEANTILDLNIYNNPFLSTCAIQSICDYLAAPNGTIEIYANGTGCNSPEEVEAACGVGLNESAVSSRQSAVIIYSNPTFTTITIELPTTPHKNTFMTLYNINGQALLSRQITEPIINVDISGLVSGVYFVKVTDERTVMVGKFVKQ